jgi:hypothetical protein
MGKRKFHCELGPRKYTFGKCTVDVIMEILVQNPEILPSL